MVHDWRAKKTSKVLVQEYENLSFLGVLKYKSGNLIKKLENLLSEVNS